MAQNVDSAHQAQNVDSVHQAQAEVTENKYSHAVL